jgi:hypothetical protein
MNPNTVNVTTQKPYSSCQREDELDGWIMYGRSYSNINSISNIIQAKPIKNAALSKIYEDYEEENEVLCCYVGISEDQDMHVLCQRKLKLIDLLRHLYIHVWLVHRIHLYGSKTIH